VPVTLIPLALIADWIGQRRHSARARDFGLCCLLLGWISTGAAVALGYVDLGRVMRNPPTHANYPYLLLHAKLAWLLLALVTVQFFWRWQIALGRVRHQHLYLPAAGAITALLFFEAWYGGELVYTLGVGAGPAQSVTDPAEARKTLDQAHAWVTHVPGMSTHDLPTLEETPPTPALSAPPRGK